MAHKTYQETTKQLSFETVDIAIADLPKKYFTHLRFYREFSYGQKIGSPNAWHSPV